MSHPVHPAVVHFPVACWVLATAADVLGLFWAPPWLWPLAFALAVLGCGFGLLAAAAGFLATTDKSKLDGIAAGAQVNVVTSVAAKTGAVTLSASDIIGLAGTVINARLFFVSGF